MPYTVEYYNERVLAQIEAWPVGIHADYARIGVLHALAKKTQATSSRDLKVARGG